MNYQIREVKNCGNTRWLVDLRKIGKGRKFFETEKAASDYVAGMVGKFTPLTQAELLTVMLGKEKLAARNATWDDCLEFFITHHKATASVTLSHASGIFYDDKSKAGRRIRYVKNLKTVLNSLEAFTPEESKGVALGKSFVHQINRAHIEGWLSKQKWSQATRRFNLGVARVFFAFAIERGWCSLNPCRGFQVITTDDKPPQILSVDQCKRLLAAVRKDKLLLPYTALALFAGIRPEEISRMEWSDIDLDRAHAEVKAHKSKTRQRRLVTLSPNCIAWLKKARKKTGPFIASKTTFRRHWKQARKEAKLLPWPHDCLRHSFCSYHLAAHRSASKTALEAGHSEAMLFRHYRELVTPSDAKLFWSLHP